MPRFLFALSGHVEVVAANRKEAGAMLKEVYISVERGACVIAVPLPSQLIHQEPAEGESVLAVEGEFDNNRF